MGSNMNIGQHSSDLIRLANELQRISADGTDYKRIYELALEIRDVSHSIRTWATSHMKPQEKI
jgi:hypothetical protein